MPAYEGYREVHVNTLLSNMSVAHFQDRSKFVSSTFFTQFPVAKASDTYTVFPQGYFNRPHNSKRTEEGKANAINYGSKTATYSVDEDALRLFISDKKRANADPSRNLDYEGTEAVTNAIMIGREVDFAAKFLHASNSPWTTKITSANWTEGSGDPVDEVKTQKRAFMLQSGGKMPNKMLMTQDVFDELTERTDIVARVQYGGSNAVPAQVSKQALAALFEIDEIVVLQTVINTAADGIVDGNGDPAVTNAFLASETVLMAYVGPISLYSATSATTFVWNQYIPLGLDAGPSIRKYRESPAIKGEWIEAELAIDQAVVSNDMAILWTAILTA